jgi:hypothetical protein
VPTLESGMPLAVMRMTATMSVRGSDLLCMMTSNARKEQTFLSWTSM